MRLISVTLMSTYSSSSHTLLRSTASRDSRPRLGCVRRCDYRSSTSRRSRAVAPVAAEAEEADWDGVFVWNKLRWPAPVRRVADPWVTLAAIATATEQP